MAKKYVYFFGAGKADGKAAMKNLLGGKGANLAEMAGHPKLKLPVPPGFTITTEVCTEYYKNNRKYPRELKKQVDIAMVRVEKIMGKKFGDPKDPLLVSIRSGARASMPGMMETILNAGLTTKTIPGLIKKTNNPRFVYDAYRRLMMMYSDVVMEKAAGIEPKTDHDAVRHKLESALEAVKKKKGYKSDTDLTVDDLKKLCDQFKKIIKQTLKKPFPDTHQEQLWGSIGAVFASWMGRRAVSYRKIEGLPDWWGTAVNVQSMVFGNTGNNSATGVAFTRNPATGENMFFGEWLPNAQGEDVVAGLRTPNPVNKAGKTADTRHLPSLEEKMPKLYKELHSYEKRLETHYTDMQDIEFTIEDGRLWMLQTRVGKGTDRLLSAWLSKWQGRDSFQERPPYFASSPIRSMNFSIPVLIRLRKRRGPCLPRDFLLDRGVPGEEWSLPLMMRKRGRKRERRLSSSEMKLHRRMYTACMPPRRFLLQKAA